MDHYGPQKLSHSFSKYTLCQFTEYAITEDMQQRELDGSLLSDLMSNTLDGKKDKSDLNNVSVIIIIHSLVLLTQNKNQSFPF